jgi:hypothetical protein
MKSNHFSLPSGTYFLKDQKVIFLCYFCLDTKVTKKSRPNRNLTEQSQKFRKKIFFCGISSTTLFRQISEWPLKKIYISLSLRRRVVARNKNSLRHSLKAIEPKYKAIKDKSIQCSCIINSNFHIRGKAYADL